MLMIVDNPVGQAAMYTDCVVFLIFLIQSSGYTVYLTIEIAKKEHQSITFRAKMTTEIQYSQLPLYGSWFTRTDTTPVPIVTANHLQARIRLDHKFRRLKQVLLSYTQERLEDERQLTTATSTVGELTTA